MAATKSMSQKKNQRPRLHQRGSNDLYSTPTACVFSTLPSHIENQARLGPDAGPRMTCQLSSASDEKRRTSHPPVRPTIDCHDKNKKEIKEKKKSFFSLTCTARNRPEDKTSQPRLYRSSSFIPSSAGSISRPPAGFAWPGPDPTAPDFPSPCRASPPHEAISALSIRGYPPLKAQSDSRFPTSHRPSIVKPACPNPTEEGHCIEAGDESSPPVQSTGRAARLDLTTSINPAGPRR
jgi:hypothetical protein